MVDAMIEDYNRASQARREVTLEDSPEMVFSAVPFGEGEYVVDVRPVAELPWNSAPLSFTLSQRDAERVAAWAAGAWPALYRIAVNMYRAGGDDNAD